MTADVDYPPFYSVLCIRGDHPQCPGLCQFGVKVHPCACRCHGNPAIEGPVVENTMAAHGSYLARSCEKCGKVLGGPKLLKKHMADEHAY